MSPVRLSAQLHHSITNNNKVLKVKTEKVSKLKSVANLGGWVWETVDHRSFSQRREGRAGCSMFSIQSFIVIHSQTLRMYATTLEWAP